MSSLQIRAAHEAGMPEQHEGDTEARESHLQRRLRQAEELAAQMRAAPEQRQPRLAPDDRPPPAAQPAATAWRPAETIAGLPPAPRTPARRPPAESAAPLTIDADWPLLREFMAGASQFRQLSIGDLLDGAFRLYRRRFVFLIAIAALPLAPAGLVQLLFQRSDGGQALALFIQSVLLMPLISATLIHCIARTRADAPPSLGAAYRAGLGRYPSLLLAVLLQGLLIGIPAAVIGGCLGLLLLPGSLGGGSAPLILVVVLILLLVLPIVTRLILANQAIVLERCGAVDGLKRSWNLTSGWFWRTFWVSTCAAILTYLIGTLPALTITFALGLADPASASSLAPSITTAVSQAGLIAALPLQLAISTLLYVDLRIRREGYDLELLARQAEAPNMDDHNVDR
jgi:hypothetical protein